MENKLHVVYILTKLELGGAQKVCLALFKGIRELGGITTIISGSQGELLSELKDFDNVYLLDSFRREVGIRTIWFEIKTFLNLFSYLRKLKKQYSNIVVHTHSTKAGIIGRIAAFLAGIKNRVHTVHGFGFNNYQSKLHWFIIYLLEAVVCLITTHYICVSSVDLEEGSRILPGFRKKSSIIRAAVEVEKFYLPAIRVKSDFVYGTVSCFKPQKNLLDLLEAFKNVIQNSTRASRLQIIGDGVMRNELEAWISANNMGHCIDLLGWQKDVASWMRTWDVYVMSSLWEGLPCAIIEARLLRLPVIAYNIGGISDVIQSNVNGYLVLPKDIDNLAKKMRILLDDTAIYNTMRSYKEDLSEFNYNVMTARHFETYNNLLL